MDTIKIGVLSDTHLHNATDQFKKIASQCFHDVSIIFHAGDLTNISVLEVFNDKEVHAVHGNMCNASSFNALPEKKVVHIGTHKIAITHGMQYPIKHGSFIEDQLLLDFTHADCIIYGHTHVPVCHNIGPVLMMNPGSFRPTGPHGAPGTFGILEIDTTLRGKIFEVPNN